MSLEPNGAWTQLTPSMGKLSRKWGKKICSILIKSGQIWIGKSDESRKEIKVVASAPFQPQLYHFFAMDVDWCLSCSRHSSTCTHNHSHPNVRVPIIHVPISRRDELDDNDDDDDLFDDEPVIIPIRDAPTAAISRWASQVPPNASPDVAPHDPSRPPCLAVKPTRPSPPTLCLHTPEKVVTIQQPAEYSPSSSAIPLRRMSPSSSRANGLLSTIASHVKSLVSRPHYHSPTSEPESDLWWNAPSSSKYPIPPTSASYASSSFTSSSASASTSSSLSTPTHPSSYLSSQPASRPQKPLPISIDPLKSKRRYNTNGAYPYPNDYDNYEYDRDIGCGYDCYAPQPRYLPIPPSHSSMKQRRLVEDFEELDEEESENCDIDYRVDGKRDYYHEGWEDGTPVQQPQLQLKEKVTRGRERRKAKHYHASARSGRV
ncbi:hypothetical protein D9758_011225 [Tetrapyrgos nigripes]|uniref:Uncharacterized protein n=1 Tax=Tetrapyrgos nigripes TaxID=182062 RepID=A0A8H5D6N3_9AGAR|nr:hypothetical protein D9758_011225 [Tetrapyrgos nigripes]